MRPVRDIRCLQSGKVEDRGKSVEHRLKHNIVRVEQLLYLFQDLNLASAVSDTEKVSTCKTIVPMMQKAHLYSASDVKILLKHGLHHHGFDLWACFVVQMDGRTPEDDGAGFHIS